MATHLNDDWTFQGFSVVRMENEFLRIEILPQLGGKIWTIEHRPSGRQFLWHHPKLRLQSLPMGANYDDHFFGGFDELLPNDMAEQVNGENLVDHGELWTTPLKHRVEGSSVVLEGTLPITPLRYRKIISLEGNSIRLDYRLENIGRSARDILWKLHPALRIAKDTEIVVPATLAEVADPQWSRMPGLGRFPWAEQPLLHRVPELGRGAEFLYLLELTDGVCELRNLAERWSFRLRFSKEIFSSVWLFASYGGWRDLEVLILEPCTTPRLSLAESAQKRECLRLEPSETVETTVRIECAAEA